ncbi:tetratricopeptide repeat protein [Treponema lecithinolyticum]
MNPANPLESVIFIRVPENFTLSSEAFHIDTAIPLPVQKEDGSAQFDIASLTKEQIFAGILTVLAYDTANEHTAYYRSLLTSAKPHIKEELTEAAILKAKNEDFEIAEEIFSALRGLDPEDPATILNSALFFDQRADSYRRSGLNEDADAYDESAHRFYKAAMESESVVPDAFFNAGFFYLKQKNFVKGKSCFETYLTLVSSLNDDEKNENVRYKIDRAKEIVFDIGKRNLDDELFKSAYDFISMGQEEKALDYIRRFLEKNSTVWNAWFLLGWALRRLQRWQDAKAAFEQCLACGGENGDTYNELAICFMELQNYEQAEKHLLQALKSEPENTKIMSNLGFLMLKKGKTEQARSYFSAVLEFDPNDRIAKKALEDLESSPPQK